MKKNTPLEYAEFLLTHSRTRCELYIYANGAKEKLASGYLKPFFAHLREAEAQFAKGNQAIRLERPSNFLKKNKVTWFTKGTLERFVRFVSTPEILERVKNIDDELSQLEHVRAALSKTSLQSEDLFYSMDTTGPGVHQTKGSVPLKNKRGSMGVGDNGADGSKIELLRAMDVRLVALKQEQSEAFTRAMAAGFDSSNMADLLDFSEHFGAERLREACIQFIGLFRRRNIAQEIAGVESPSAAAASSDSDMSLESCTDVELLSDTGEHCLVGVEGERSKAVKSISLDYTGKLETKDDRETLGSNPSARTRSRWGPPERLQINQVDPEVQDSEISRKKGEAKHHLGNYNHQDDIRDSDSGLTAFKADGELQATMHLKEQSKRPSLTDCPVPFMNNSAGNRLQGMQQGEGNMRAGMFFSRLHKMAQQVEARRLSEDLGVHFTSVERSADLSGSQLSGYGYSSSLNNSVVNPSGNSPLCVVSDVAQFSQGNTSSGLEEASKMVGNSVTKSTTDHVDTEDGDLNRKVNLEKVGDLQSTTTESSQVTDNQEEPVSTSARRLSVQAAISLFESKKATVGEPPTRKLVRQNSQKAALQSGNFPTEKSVLRRWSGISNDGTHGKEDAATEASDKRQLKAAVNENAAQKAEVFEVDSRSTTKLSQSATDVSSTHADQSALQAGPMNEPPSRKLLRQNSQKSVLQKGTNATEKSVLRRWGGLENDDADGNQDTATEAGDKRQEKVVVTEYGAQKGEIFVEEDSLSTTKLPQSATDVRSTHEASLLKQMPPVQQQSCVRISSEAQLDVLPKQSNQELKKASASRSSPRNLWTNLVLPSMPLADTLKPAEVTSRRSTMIPETGNKDILSTPVCKEMVDVQADLGIQPTQVLKEPKVAGSLSIHERPPKRFPSYKEDKVDGLSDENIQFDSVKHKTGKSRLTENSLLFKNISEPEKEPSLILHETPVDLYMQALVMMIDNHHQSVLSSGDEESFKEQRGRFYDRYWQLRNARQKGENPAKKAEREAKLKSMQEILERRKAEMEAGVFRQMKNGRLVKEQEGVSQHVGKSGPFLIQQKEKEMGEVEVVGQQGGLVLASSHIQPMPKTKVQPSRKTTPKLQKSVSASHSLLTTPLSSSPRTMPKGHSGAGASVNNQRKVATSSCSVPVDSPMYRNLPLDTTGDASKFTSVCTEPSGKSNGKMNGYSHFANIAVSALCECDGAADALSRTAASLPSDTRNGQSFSSEGGFLPGQAHHSVAVETFKENKGLAKFSTPGSSLMKHEVFDHLYSSESYNEQSCSSFDGVENGTESFSNRREAMEDFDVGKSPEASIGNHTLKYSFLMHPEKSRPNVDKLLPSIQKPLKALNQESAGHRDEDASNNDKNDQANQGRSAGNLQRDWKPLLLNDYEESSAFTSAEKSIELSQSDSINSPSLPQECTTSTYSDAAASPVNSLEESSGTVQGTYSPKLSISPYSPSGSPASLTYSKAKHPLEHERQSNVPQSCKEPARGFKRLLHFGRKNRTSEAISFDGISVSTASEGDDETDEVRESMRQSPNECIQRATPQEKVRHVNSTKDYSGFQDQRATLSLQSNTPIPASNPKLRDDHFLGRTSLKASRSFFSLANFRSRGGEGKSR